MYPSLLTSIVYFAGREIYAAIVVHNFQTLFDVMTGMINIESFRRPLCPCYNIRNSIDADLNSLRYIYA